MGNAVAKRWGGAELTRRRAGRPPRHLALGQCRLAADRKRLAGLAPPLIERIDAGEDSEAKHLVLEQRAQLP